MTSARLMPARPPSDRDGADKPAGPGIEHGHRVGETIGDIDPVAIAADHDAVSARAGDDRGDDSLTGGVDHRDGVAWTRFCPLVGDIDLPAVR